MPFEVLKSLKVLMWKHLMVRGRKYILTSMELLLPLVYFLLIHLICLHFANKRLFPIMIENMQITNLQDTESHPQNETKRDHRYLDLLLYTPDTNSTRQLMDEVGPQLNLDRLDQLSVDSLNTKKYAGVKNESFFNTFLTTKKNLKFDKFAIVIFHNVENTLPSHLRYTIKINEESYIHGYQSMYFLMNSYKNFDNDHLLFMRVQWAIDSSYLELQGVDIKKLKLSVHEVDVSSQKKLDRETISVMVHIACVMSLYIPFVLLMVKLLQERCSGVQELMKIMGVSANLLDLSHFLDVLPTGLVFSISGTVFLTVGKIAVIPDTDPLLIFIMLLLYFISVMAFAFAFSYIAKTDQYAVTLSSLAYIVSWARMELLVIMMKSNVLLLYVSGLFPHIPMSWFWTEVIMKGRPLRKSRKRNLPILDIFVQHNPGSGSVFASYVMFVLQTIIFAFISWYLNKVRPGKYGTALPYTFLFKAQFWSIKKVALITMDKEYMTTITKDRDPLYFEKPPPSAEIGIRITNLTKVYNEQKVLDNVSFDVYKGEITVLLGHNGAGKTTLMSIITGVICATEGTVTVYGLDTVQHQKQVRKLIGLCPQDNIFFPHLTVLEHVMFCAMLKGANRKAAKEFCLELLDRLKIADKANNKSEQLSGGMKRRLQLACALAGRGNVLILDEPTSGLDIKTRRELWNLLLSLRGERTVLLTTHFMEEADALGDHVATLNAGQLRALATPIYLKKNLGTGYRLSLKTIGLPQKKAITRLVMTYVPEATLKEIGLDTLEYSLPSTSSNFSTLLTQLENERSKLRIDSIGVGVSTLEEVFTKLCSDIETSFTEDTFDDELQESSYPIVRGYYLLWNQFLVLLLRRLKSMYFRKWNFFFMQVLIPILLIFAMTYMTNDPVKSDDEDHKTTMNFSMFRDMHQLKVFYKLDYKNREFLKTFRPFGNVEFEETSNIIDAILQTDEQDTIEHNKYITGLELKGDDARVYYTTTVRYAAPVALNLVSNLLAAGKNRSITTYSRPLEMFVTAAKRKAMPKSMLTMTFWAVSILFIILSTVTTSVYRLINERRAGIRHIHIMAGCPPFVHWMATFIYHVLTYTAISVVPTVIAAATMDENNTINNADFLLFIFVVLELVIMAFLAFMYFISFCFVEATALAILTFGVTVGGILPAIASILDDSGFNIRFSVILYDIPIWTSEIFMPPHAALLAFYRGGRSAQWNAQCALNMCNGTQQLNDACCKQRNPECYFCIDSGKPGAPLLILLLQTCLYMLISFCFIPGTVLSGRKNRELNMHRLIFVLLAQHGYLNQWRDKLVNMKYVRPQKHYNDKMVLAEESYVSKNIALSQAQATDAMLIGDVHKNYVSIGCGHVKKCNAVKGVSFSVKRGECFGVLGVNGAGKSSTFRTITSEDHATRGQVIANRHCLTLSHRQQYLLSLGYCRQFFGLDLFLSGWDNLALLLKLRGWSGDTITKEVDIWIKAVGLERYAKERVCFYNRDCKRRLAAAAALAQGAPVTLLDEPTAGVDATTRRYVWRALRRGQALGRTIIMTSHCLDEVEALCSRIAIMSGGELCALGSPAALRANHAAGHAVRFKLLPDYKADADSVVVRENLKTYISSQFNCTLVDEYKTMLHYHINETMHNSDLFTALESLKAAYPNLIEDYSATETTLEEVFLSFAQNPQPSYRSLSRV